MNLRYVEAFVAAAEGGHFGRAAARLHVTPSTLTRQVQAVEDKVGAALFDRTGRSATLTPAGAAFLGEARALLSRADAAADLARRVAEGRAGRLRVGFVGPAALGLLPAALRAYREAAPGVDVSLVEMRTAEQRAALASGQIDLAVLHGGLPSSADVPLASSVVREEGRWAALPAAHPLAEGEGPVALSDLAGSPFVFFERAFEPAHFDAFVAACRAAGFEPRFAQHADRVYVVLALVAAGLGVAPVTGPVVRALRYGGVAYRPLEGAGPPLPLTAVWRSDAASPARAGFVSVLVARGLEDSRRAGR